jgi:phage gpG-like protein
MAIQFKLAGRDGIAERIAKLRAQCPQKAERALRAMANQVVAHARRAFNDPSFRPAPWKERKGKRRKGQGNAILKDRGLLSRLAPGIMSVSATDAIVGTSVPYAIFHQVGTTHIPARPFFPFVGASKAQLTPVTKAACLAILQKNFAL